MAQTNYINSLSSSECTDYLNKLVLSTEPLFQVLQSKTVDIKKCQDRIKSTISALKATRTDETFTGIYDEAVKAVGEPVSQRLRRRHAWDDLEQGFNEQRREGEEDTVASYRRLYFQIVDGIVLHMTQRIKTYLRNTCGQDRIVNLAKISIDSVVVEDLKTKGNFYDKVMDHFATMNDRRMAFLYKYGLTQGCRVTPQTQPCDAADTTSGLPAWFVWFG
ncbi:unnamed protein product [Gadus morhua 'NCC']